MKRVAICFSGELRTWDYCKESIKAYFEVNHVQVDYFAHVWTSERRYFDEKRNHVLNESIPPVSVDQNNIQRMLDYYQPKKSIIEDKRKRGHNIAPFIDLFESFYKSVNLKCQYEIENNFVYDIVIKCRYDLLFPSLYQSPHKRHFDYNMPVLQHCIYNASTIVFPVEHNRLNIEDIFFHGTSFSMDKLSNIYPWLITRKLLNTHDTFNDNVSPNPLREDVIKGVSMNPINHSGPGIIMNDFMHTVHLTNKTLANPSIIIRPFSLCFDKTAFDDRNKILQTSAKVHFHEFNPPSAIIFDLDGVLVDTDLLHRKALAQAIRKLIGIDIFNKLEEKSVLSSKQKFDIVTHGQSQAATMKDEVLALKDKIFSELIQNLESEPNVITCLENIKQLNIKTAIASNSRLANINLVLEITKLKKYFDKIVSAEEVARSKPFPDLLFLAYERLGVASGAEPMKTIFVEDSDEGARAGEQSPSTVVRINNPKDLHIGLFSKWIK